MMTQLKSWPGSAANSSDDNGEAEMLSQLKSGSEAAACSDDDDEEANEDLSLKIVEKALHMRAARLASERVLSDDSDDEDDFGNELVELHKGKTLMEKGEALIEETEDRPVNTDHIPQKHVDIDIIAAEEKEDFAVAETIDAEKSTDPSAVETVDNMVLRKLLGGPRYFDSPGSSSHACYTCGEEGQAAANCSQKRKRPCFCCGSLEHKSKDCRKEKCFVCNANGHKAKDCPEKKNRGLQVDKICLKCGMSGHEMSSCGNDYSLEDLKLKVSEGMDRLSSLPDDLLICNILPLLPMKEALRTCVLAHRWRFLSLVVPFTDLDFDASAMVARIFRDNDYLSSEDILGKGGRIASDFIRWVDRVIADRRTYSNRMYRFRVCFRIDNFFYKEIDSWVRFALEQGVHVLELDCCQPDFPNYSFRAVRYPRLRFLKSLTLKGVELVEKDIERLLRESQSLERLHLCTIMGLYDLNITGPVSSLKYIDLSPYCLCLRRINITAPTPHLWSLIYPDTTRLAHLNHAPKLVDTVFNDTGDLIFHHPLFPYFSQLHTLHLFARRFGWSTMEGWTRSYPHLLSGLKHLKLFLGNCLEELGSERIFDLTFLIKAASSLQHLTLMLEVDEKQHLKMAFSQLDVHSLRVLEIVGFQGGKEECEFVQHMVKGGISLEKVIIDCRRPFLLGKLVNEYAISHYAGVRNNRDHIVQQRQRSALELMQALVLPNKLQVKLFVI